MNRWASAVRCVVRSMATLLASLLFVLSAGVLAQGQQPRQPDGLLAVPTLARITDASGVLNAEQARALEDKLSAFETAHGSQIAIVIVPSVQPEPIEDYAHRVASAWRLGRAEVGDGLLIVVATQDRRVRIDVMRALEGAVPDVVAKRIIRERIAPRFKVNDYAGGLNAALDALFKQIEGEGLPAVATSQEDSAPEFPAVLLPLIVIGVMVARGLRRVLGMGGALVASAGAGFVAYAVLASVVLGLVAGAVVAVVSVLSGLPMSHAVGGRRGGDIFLPGGWGGGSGWGGGGSSSSGGWSSGGGGDAAGGGASGDW